MRRINVLSWRVRGMTLIEVMIAIAIASTLAVASYRGLSALSNSATTLTQTAQRWQEIDAAAESFGAAFRRAIASQPLRLTPDACAFAIVDDAGRSATQTFPLASDAIARWQFAAWNGNAWVSDWREAVLPRAIKVTFATVRGESLERVYVR